MILFIRIIKSVFSSIALCAVLFLFIPVKAQQQTQDLGGYSIVSMNSSWNIKNENVNVDEIININFSEPRHGIFRYLPLSYEYNDDQGYSQYSLIQINNIKVKDPTSNQPIPFSTYINRNTIFDKNNIINGLFYNVDVIKIGDPHLTITGSKQYEITYTIDHLPGQNKVFSFNLSGTGWNVPINKFEGNIYLNNTSTDINCIYGDANSKGKNCDIVKNEKGYSLTIPTALSSGEGVQIYLKNTTFLSNNSLTSTLLLFLEENIYILMLFPFFFAILIIFILDKRKKAGIIVPQFSIPDNLSPAEVGTLYDDSVDKVDIAASIINLAVKKYINIESKDNKRFILNKLKDADKELKDFEIILINKLFEQGNTVDLNKLKQGSIADIFSSLQSEIYLSCIRNGYYKKMPEKSNSILYATFLALLYVAPGIIFGLLSTIVLIIFGILIMIIGYIAFYFRNFDTEKGNLTKNKIQGLKLFIEYAKKDQLDMMDTPLSKQMIFETYLPYAMVLKLHKSWAKLFKDMDISKPDWYIYNGNDMWNTIFFVTYIDSFSYRINNIFSVPMSQTGSGFMSGGESIGGGFSGGGGGSW